MSKAIYHFVPCSHHQTLRSQLEANFMTLKYYSYVNHMLLLSAHATMEVVTTIEKSLVTNNDTTDSATENNVVSRNTHLQ